ncbi:sensor histidine kinase [Nitrospira sp. NS4]|uniref:sensor histidine kinase n=1 Tax=Nitrospira sp. NS4 TaxID=3414498 RepID=UPI003C306BFB
MRATRPLHTPPTKVAILGAGRGGTALLDLLHQIPAIDIVGISDRDPRAPGLQRARDLHIPVVDQIDDLLQNHHTQLVLDVTGDPTMDQRLRREVRSGVDVLSGSASRVVWELVQHESALQAELLHAEKLAGIGSFAAGIAHDINNPLQLILGLAENLAEETDLHTVHEQAREIIDAVKRTTAICRDLTSYARRSAAHQQSLVDVNTKLDDALKIARYAVAFQDIEVVKLYAPDATIPGNPDELLHVFVNLITNAVQAMERGGTLTLRTMIQETVVSVQVSDTGCGIPPDLFNEIFEPFFTTKPPGKGTGLGLYNIKHVIHQMHGTIAVTSDVGVGSTFTIALPRTTPV